MLASLLHLLFEFLAFRSDVNFWYNAKSIAGLSARAVVSDLLSQVVVFGYLLISETSLLITVPSFIAIGIQAWKVKLSQYHHMDRIDQITMQSIRAVALSMYQNNNTEEEAVAEDSTSTETSQQKELRGELEKLTVEADAFANFYIGSLLLPVVIGFIGRSLIYEKHSSWLSWALQSLTGCVYSFGFIGMFPQLYINYKLKSVSHLPWNVS